MAVATLKAFIQQSLALQYADLTSAGVLVRKDEQSYYKRTETYTFLTATFLVRKNKGVVTDISIDCAKIPALA
jgi:hypothetical protein